MATQSQHDEAQRKLREWRRATAYQPDQFKDTLHETPINVVPMPGVSHLHDYLFNLTGIVPPQLPKWKQVNHLYEDFKKFQRSCTRVFEGPMAHVSDKVKVNMLLLWCGPDGEDIYNGFNLDEEHEYDLELVWSLFDHHCKPLCNFHAARWNSGL